MHQSIATIDSPEFINLQPLDINPLMSACEIKVLYLGGNRNRSFINKEVATEMAKTLRGAPIVGYYKEDKEDFADHGERVIIDDEGVKFEVLTKPYGFVSPDANVWFQKFEEQDEFGNTVVREYLMTTGYLWTEQFKECKSAVVEGRPQSMELDEKTLDGTWSMDFKSNIEFFIIHDAIFSKLCILGEDVEPCFEGASVTAPVVSKNFSLMDDNFKNTLYTMMQQLQYALKGGQTDMDEMAILNAEATEETVLEINQEPEVVEEKAPEIEAEPAENFSAENEQIVSSENEENVEENTDVVEAPEETADVVETPVEEEPSAIEKEYALLQAEHEELKASYATLQAENAELVSTNATLTQSCETLTAFKLAVEDAQKDEMIARFYMLSEEDKREIIENKTNFTLEEIEEKLSVICFRKKVNFDSSDSDKIDKNTEKNTQVITYNLSDEGASAPAWLAAVDRVISNRK